MQVEDKWRPIKHFKRVLVVVRHENKAAERDCGGFTKEGAKTGEDGGLGLTISG